MIKPKTEQQKVTFYSNALMILTSIHHIYGSVVYHTPWRLHVLFLSIPVILIITFISRFMHSKEGLLHKLLFALYWLTILSASLLSIGIFEGLYNHVLKNVLFFSGMQTDRFSTLFPPPTYEVPNDVFFELTGVLQGLVGIVLGVYFIRLTKLAVKGKIHRT